MSSQFHVRQNFSPKLKAMQQQKLPVMEAYIARIKDFPQWQIDGGAFVTDGKLFCLSHLSFIKSNMGMIGYYPYYVRLSNYLNFVYAQSN